MNFEFEESCGMFTNILFNTNNGQYSTFAIGERKLQPKATIKSYTKQYRIAEKNKSKRLQKIANIDL